MVPSQRRHDKNMLNIITALLLQGPVLNGCTPGTQDCHCKIESRWPRPSVTVCKIRLPCSPCVEGCSADGACNAPPLPDDCDRMVHLTGADWSLDFCVDASAPAALSAVDLDLASDDVSICIEDLIAGRTVCHDAGMHPWCLDDEGGCVGDAACCILSIVETACCEVLGECCLFGDE